MQRSIVGILADALGQCIQELLEGKPFVECYQTLRASWNNLADAERRATSAAAS